MCIVCAAAVLLFSRTVVHGPLCKLRQLCVHVVPVKKRETLQIRTIATMVA